jgi:hypothetical protein
MRTTFLLLILFSSLLGRGQVDWEGEYTVEYKKELKIPRESKVKFWRDSSGLRWTFNAFQRNAWMWESAGTAVRKDPGVWELYFTEYKDFRPKMQKRVTEKLRKLNLVYKVTSIDGVLYIEALKGKEKLRLIKSV